MTDDIVKYMRLSQTRFNRHDEAADEIERLRAELLEAQQGLGLLWRSRDKRDDEIERLRKAGNDIIDALTEMAEKQMLPKVTVRLLEVSKNWFEAINNV